MTEKEVARWGKIREKGKWPFVFGRAVLSTALFFTLTAIFAWLLSGPFDQWLLILAFSPIVGILGGLTTWWTNDAKYQNLILDKKIQTDLTHNRN